MDWDIVGARITDIDGKRKTTVPVIGIKNINIGLKDMRTEKELLFLPFIYQVEYNPDVGYLKLEGEVVLREKENAKKTESEKKLPKDVLEAVFNYINYVGGVNGVFVSHVLRLAPPITPRRFKVQEEKEKKKE